MTKLWITLTLILMVIVGVCLYRLPVLHLTIAFYVILIATAIGIVVAGVLSAGLLQAYILHRIGAQENFNDARSIAVLTMRNRAVGRRGRANLAPMPELVSGDYQTVEIE